MAESTEQPVGGEPTTARQLSFYGQGGSLFGIHIVNILLAIITLGIYYFWGKVRVRNYMHSQTEFEGDRFAYHGTGKELFFGWLKAMVFLIVIGGLSFGIQLFGKSFTSQIIGTLILYVGILFLFFPVAIVGAWRFKLSRTSWRGIRFSFRGHTREFFRIYFPGMFLTLITLGFYSPYFEVRLRKFLVNQSYFGNAQFQFDGNGRDLFWGNFWAIVLAIPTLGIYPFWYAATRHRYFWSRTTFSTAQFRSTMLGGDLFVFQLVNGLLLIFTLGLAQPWVLVRSARFTFERILLEGDLDLDVIEQDARDASATGEGMTDFLDTEFLDIDLGLL